MNHIKELGETIHRLHGAKAKHSKSVPVKEDFEGQTVWDGIVEVFDLTGHPQTDKAYAWMHDTENPKRPKRRVTVLNIPPVVSPETAVRAVIVQEYRKHGKRHEN